MPQVYDCDQCGACCKSLIIEAGWIDAVREPRLLTESNRHGITLDDLRGEDRCLMLYDIQTHACPFLIDPGEGKCSCSIYPTRPNVCITCEAGSPKCQQARMMKQLPLLKDVAGNVPDLSMWHEVWDEEYGEDFIEEQLESARESV